MSAPVSQPASGPASRDDRGSAIVEFLVLAVLMLLPLVYLVATLGRVQAGAFAVQGAAREAGRAFVTAADEAAGRDRADAAAAVAAADQGFGPGLVVVVVQCAQQPCLSPDARVLVHASVTVVLPLVPALVDRVVPARVVLDADAVAVVDRFGAR